MAAAVLLVAGSSAFGAPKAPTATCRQANQRGHASCTTRPLTCKLAPGKPYCTFVLTSRLTATATNPADPFPEAWVDAAIIIHGAVGAARRCDTGTNALISDPEDVEPGADLGRTSSCTAEEDHRMFHNDRFTGTCSAYGYTTPLDFAPDQVRTLNGPLSMTGVPSTVSITCTARVVQ